jgi:hypothetical protein
MRARELIDGRGVRAGRASLTVRGLRPSQVWIGVAKLTTIGVAVNKVTSVNSMTWAWTTAPMWAGIGRRFTRTAKFVPNPIRNIPRSSPVPRAASVFEVQESDGCYLGDVLAGLRPVEVPGIAPT